jgi:hypothetical protein
MRGLRGGGNGTHVGLTAQLFDPGRLSVPPFGVPATIELVFNGPVGYARSLHPEILHACEDSDRALLGLCCRCHHSAAWVIVLGGWNRASGAALAAEQLLVPTPALRRPPPRRLLADHGAPVGDA